MATHKLNTPIRIGDLKNGITVDALELVSISINFQPVLDTPKDRPAHIKYWRDRVHVSCLLRHPGTDWTHNVVLGEQTKTDKEAAVIWAALKAKFPEFEAEVLKLLQPHLPPGEIS